MRKNNRYKDTSWQKVSKWYNKLQGKKGDFFHEQLIFPHLKKLVKISADTKMLELGCGQGVYARQLPPGVRYVGYDLSEALVNDAKKHNKNPNAKFYFADATLPLDLEASTFDYCIIMLALQNMPDSIGAIRNASKALKPGGKLIIVLNHPYFRIPRQSGWGINDNNKSQYRWVLRYMSELEIPIEMTPGQRESKKTWSYHKPLSAYIKELAACGLTVADIDELVSPKESVGRYSKSENLARAEIPMFMVIVAEKK